MLSSAPDMVRIRLKLFPMLLLLFAGCSSMKPADVAAVDMEIERAILWDFRNETRFDAVEVTCRNSVVLLKGSVPGEEAAREALERARKAAKEWDSGVEVVSEIQVR